MKSSSPGFSPEIKLFSFIINLIGLISFLNLIIAAGTRGFNCDKGPLIYSSLVLTKYSRSFPSKIVGISFAIILNNTGSNYLAVQ